MSATEIKRSFHELIDSIENEGILYSFYELLKNKTSNVDGHLWNKLTVEEQNELLQTIEDSNYPENVINHSEIVKKHSKWL
ncbi:MAG: hypothetical protein R2771_13295 [Saprospiraceae bacterium]